MKLRAKKIACNLAALLCEEDMNDGMIELRYASIESKGGPSVELIRAQMVIVIEELRHRGRPI